MRKKLIQLASLGYYYKKGKRILNTPTKAWGDITNLTGIIDHLTGDLSNIRGEIHPKLKGDVSKLKGCITNIIGDASCLFGDIDKCKLMEKDFKKKTVKLQDLIADPKP
jgi:hypothetical protein